MQTFSLNMTKLLLVCAVASTAHASPVDVTNHVVDGVTKKALAFKRRAAMTQELGNQIQRLGHPSLTLADEKPQPRLVSSNSPAQSQQASTSRDQNATSTLAAKDRRSDSEKSGTNTRSTLPQTSFSHISSFWQSSNDKKTASNHEKMKVYREPSTKAKVLTQVSPAQNFSVEQGDWVKIKTSEGVVGWSLVKDVEQNITNAWADEYQVIMNGQSSNYTVTKISAEERKKRQKAMIERQNQRLKQLSALWEQDFFHYDDVQGRQDEIKTLKDQVMALNEQIKDLQAPKKDTA